MVPCNGVRSKYHATHTQVATGPHGCDYIVS